MPGSTHVLRSRVDAMWTPGTEDPKTLVFRFAAHHLLAAPPCLHGKEQLAHTSYVSELGIAMRNQPFRHALPGKLSDAFVGTPYFSITKAQNGAPLITLNVAALVSGASDPAERASAVNMAEPSSAAVQVCAVATERVDSGHMVSWYWIRTPTQACQDSDASCSHLSRLSFSQRRTPPLATNKYCMMPPASQVADPSPRLAPSAAPSVATQAATPAAGAAASEARAVGVPAAEPVAAVLALDAAAPALDVAAPAPALSSTAAAVLALPLTTPSTTIRAPPALDTPAPLAASSSSVVGPWASEVLHCAIDAFWAFDAGDPKTLALRFAAQHLLVAPPYQHGGGKMAHTVDLCKLGAAMQDLPFRRALTGKLGKVFVGSPFFEAAQLPGGHNVLTLNVAAILQASSTVRLPARARVKKSFACSLLCVAGQACGWA